MSCPRTIGRGWAVIDVIIALAFLGALTTVAVTTVQQKIRASHRVEAVDMLGRIRDSVSQSGAHDHIGALRSGRLARLVGGERVQRLCRAAIPVPSHFDAVSGGKKYQPHSGEWASGSPEAGWRCLRMNGGGSQRYQYGYNTELSTSSGGTEGYYAWARGDLDGDGRTSYYRISGNLVDGRVIHDEKLLVVDGSE